MGEAIAAGPARPRRGGPGCWPSRCPWPPWCSWPCSRPGGSGRSTRCAGSSSRTPRVPLTKPLPSLYLGKIYAFSLPWHNTLVLTAVTTPVAWLGLGLFGLVAALARRRTEPWALIWPCSWLVLMIVHALPRPRGTTASGSSCPASPASPCWRAWVSGGSGNGLADGPWAGFFPRHSCCWRWESPSSA